MKAIFVVRCICIAALLCLSFAVGAQNTGVSNTASAGAAKSSVTQIDALALKRLLKPNGKPLLVNFWATWCDPCREEFPELVKINDDYRGKIDFITVSLDDLEDKDTAVPKFLAEMKAAMPAYLLVTQDEGAAIAGVSKDWSGGLPFTMLFNDKGGTAYFRQGKIKPDLLRTELEKVVTMRPTN